MAKSKVESTATVPAGRSKIEAGSEAQPVQAVMQFRRLHPGGGPLGRCSYGFPGVPGIVVFDVALFANGVPPATIVVNFAAAQPQSRKAAGVTSAVVAAVNSAQAAVTGSAIAPPAQVAQVAQVAGNAVVAATKSERPVSSEAIANAKAAAARIAS